MTSLNEPSPHGQRRSYHHSAEPLEGGRCSYDIDDCVDRADFVEVHLVDGHLVDFGFGLRQAGEKMARA